MADDSTQKPAVDWDLIEVEYRAGVKSLQQIGDEFGITKGRISQVAKKRGWARDINAKIRAKADERVNVAAVNDGLNKRQVVYERDVVEANAELQYRIRMEHRTDIGRTRKLFAALLGEVESATLGREQMDALIAASTAAVNRAAEMLGDRVDLIVVKSMLNDVADGIHKVSTIGGRIDSAKKLSEILERLVKLERQAFGIKDDDDGAASGVEALLDLVHEATNGK